MGRFAEVINPDLATYGLMVEVIRQDPANAQRFYPLALVETGDGRRFWVRHQNLSPMTEYPCRQCQREDPNNEH